VRVGNLLFYLVKKDLRSEKVFRVGEAREHKRGSAGRWAGFSAGLEGGTCRDGLRKRGLKTRRENKMARNNQNGMKGGKSPWGGGKKKLNGIKENSLKGGSERRARLDRSPGVSQGFIRGGDDR